jgi:hypothetical protein
MSDEWDAGEDTSPIPPRRRRRDAPIALDTTHVPVRGEALHPIWWRGKQWAETPYGIECLDGTYAIERDRLAEDLDNDGSWLAHMGEKTWVDPEEFATTWLVALAFHGVTIPAETVRRTVARAVIRSEP